MDLLLVSIYILSIYIYYIFSKFTVIYTAHAFGIFPVLIGSRLDVESVRFKWISLPNFVGIFITCAAFFEFGVAIYNILETEVSFKTTGPILFYIVSICGIYCYFTLAKKWPKFIGIWRKIEAPFLERAYQTKESLRINKDMIRIGFGFLICAFCKLAIDTSYR